MTLADELRGMVRGEVDDAPATLEKYSRDASLFVIRPQVVVYPRDAEDICALVRFVTEKKKQGISLSLTPRAAGTDMSGGPLNDSIILDMTRHFNRIREVGDGYVVVEPGVFYRDFDVATKAHGWELPSYTASRDLNTVGGMVGNNSGGEKNLKFGKTARYVEELDVVLADGRVHTLRLVEHKSLEMKSCEAGFEGDVYEGMRELLGRGRDIIRVHTPTVEKNSSGYALWDIGDGVQSLNLARLMVGAQGTLGIVTRIRFKLVHPEPYAAMTVMFVDSLAELCSLVPEVLSYAPDSFESYDDHTFKLGVKYFPEFAARLGANLLSVGISFLPELWMLYTGGVPKLVLLAEFRSESQADAIDKARKLARDITAFNPSVRVRVAENETAARKYWIVRRESFNLLRKKVRGKRTAPFIDDFVVPPNTLPQFLPELQTILERYDLFYTIAGHIGDGNFHIIPLVDPKDPTLSDVIDAMSHEVYDLVLKYHGSITGEHNDGLVRTPYVEKMFGKEMYTLFEEVKRLFDPLTIFNPHKKVGGTFAYAKKHLDIAKGN